VKFAGDEDDCNRACYRSRVQLPHVDPEQMARFERSMAVYEETVSSCIIPIYTLTDERVVTAAGSALLVRATHDAHLLITAGHVLDHKPLLTWGGGLIGFIGLEGEALTTEPRTPRRHEDRLDLAVLKLTADCVGRLAQTDARFAPGSLLNSEKTPAGFYSFIGYPETLNEPCGEWDGEQTTYTIQRHIISFRVQKAPEEAYRRVCCRPGQNFLGLFNHEELIATGDLTVVAGPLPRGISGGPVFYLGSADDIYHHRRTLRLAGIGTEYHHREGLIVAASIVAVRHIVAAALA
jgi:hypothetical protein